MDEILGKRENTVSHASSCTSTAEVANLEPLIYLGTALSGDCTVAGNKAPRIQRAATLYGDRSAGVQPEVTIIANHSSNLTATSRVVLTTNADGALHRQGRIGGQHQLAVCFGRCRRSGCRGCFLVQCGGSIKRHQQRNTGGDGIAARQCAVSGDNDGLVRTGLRRSDGVAQVRIRLTANTEGCRGACTGVRLRLDRRGRDSLRLIRQSCQLDIVGRICMRDQLCREQNRNQQYRQRQGQKALEYLFHFF